MEFYCGAAREVITPVVGTLLYGYRPDLVSKSVHDDLTITAVAFSNGAETVLLISATLGDFHTDLDRELREKAAAEAGIPWQNVILTATHTHCGPNTSGEVGWGEIDRPYVDDIFLPALLKVSRDAVNGMKPAEAGIAEGNSDIGINRREFREDGIIRLGQNPWGLIDPVMTVIAVREVDTAKGIVNLIHYGCHGTACGAGTEITRDWSGLMIDRVEQLTSTLTVFFNGAIGDVGPRLTNGRTTGDITYVEELGANAAMDAMRVCREIRSYRTLPLTVKKDSVRLPYKAFPPAEQVRAFLESVTEPEKLINSRKLRYQYYFDVNERLTSGNTAIPDGLTFPQTLVLLGDVCLIPIPFEFFAEISLRLRAYSGLQHTLCLSCANGYNGYLPTEDQLCRGGYEVDVFSYGSVFSLADDTDANLIWENLRILRS